MNPNIITGQRLKLLRIRRNLSQKDFSELFSTFIGRKAGEAMALMTISNWETGKKLPTTATLRQLCSFYEVTSDYLLGLSDDGPGDDDNPLPKKQQSPSELLEIQYLELPKYDGKPVFISATNYEFAPQWALVNWSNHYLATATFHIPISPDFKYSIATPPELITVQDYSRHFISLKDVLRLDYVYIESLSLDPGLKAAVSGWYHHLPGKKGLINDRGITLSYEGINVAYKAVDTKLPTKINSSPIKKC